MSQSIALRLSLGKWSGSTGMTTIFTGDFKTTSALTTTRSLLRCTSFARQRRTRGPSRRYVTLGAGLNLCRKFGNTPDDLKDLQAAMRGYLNNDKRKRSSMEQLFVNPQAWILGSVENRRQARDRRGASTGIRSRLNDSSISPVRSECSAKTNNRLDAGQVEGKIANSNEPRAVQCCVCSSHHVAAYRRVDGVWAIGRVGR